MRWVSPGFALAGAVGLVLVGYLGWRTATVGDEWAPATFMFAIFTIASFGSAWAWRQR